MASFPWMSSPSLTRLFTALTDDPFQSTSTIRFVGGCVRDFLLERPWKDVDLATVLSPEAIILKLQAAHIPFITPGILHGTITALLDHRPFEITTLRKDLTSDGRHSQVEFINNWEEDAFRRDFTLNALFMDWTGHIYDFVGGITDLNKGYVRFVGDPAQRIQEDFLRILRFFRMYALYGKIPPKASVLNVIQTYVDKLSTLSRERIHTELFKILDAPHSEKSLYQMKECGVLKHLSPYFEIPSYFHYFANQEALLKFASLLLQTETHLTASDLKPLLLSSKDLKRVLDILRHKPFLIDNECLGFSSSFLFRTKFPLYQDLILLKAGILRMEFSKVQALLTKAKGTFPHLIFPVTGQDLLNLGLEEGPLLGKILTATQEKWLETNCQLSKGDCLEFAKRLMEGP